MPRRNRFRRRQGRRRVGDRLGGFVLETVTGNTPVGSSGQLTRANLSSVPSGRSFRVRSVRVEAVGAMFYVAGDQSRTGYFPAWIQVRIYNAAGTQGIATSGPRLLGPNPIHFSFPNHPSSDFSSEDIPGGQVILAVDVGCIRPSGPASAAAAYILHLDVEMGPEEQNEACPKFSHVGDPVSGFQPVPAQ